MIINKLKYNKFLTILSGIGIFFNITYANDFSYNLSKNNLSSYSKSNSFYQKIIPSIETTDKKVVKFISSEEKALEIAKKFAPEKIEEISTEYIKDELGELIVISVYLDFSKELNDEDYIKASNEANEVINTKNILIKYL